MARIAGVDLPREKRIEIGLTYIYGIGRPSADKILAKAEVNQVSEEEFYAELQKMADMYKMELSQIKEFMGEFEGKQIRSDIAIQKAVDLIVNSTVEK